MKKLLTALLAVTILLGGCAAQATPQFDRIVFAHSAEYETALSRMDADTIVRNNSGETFPTTMPVYKIEEISFPRWPIEAAQAQLDAVYTQEAQKMRVEQIDSGNIIIDRVKKSNAAKPLDITMEELEQQAWKVLRMLDSLLEGEYEYIGIMYEESTSISVGFARVLDGVRLDRSAVVISFDADGLQEVNMKAYRYKKVGTIELLSPQEAVERIKTPDDFSLYAEQMPGEGGPLRTMEVNHAELRLFAYDGMLQPVYQFTGTTTDQQDNHGEFHAKISAVPESYIRADA